MFIAAAGNNATGHNTLSTPIVPCDYNFAHIICVAASTQNDTLATFSDYGTATVHVVAPGKSIESTLIGDNYGYLDGTSMAAPVVAAIASLVRSYRPTLSRAQVRQLIFDNVDVLSAYTDKVQTNGRVNLYQTLYCSYISCGHYALSGVVNT